MVAHCQLFSHMPSSQNEIPRHNCFACTHVKGFLISGEGGGGKRFPSLDLACHPIKIKKKEELIMVKW